MSKRFENFVSQTLGVLTRIYAAELRPYKYGRRCILCLFTFVVGMLLFIYFLFMGNDLYPSIYDKAAQLCYGIANNHPFTDGNKRTALHSMYVYLIINGFDITATQQDVENLIIDIAAGNMTNTELAQWLRENTVEIDTNL